MQAVLNPALIRHELRVVIEVIINKVHDPTELTQVICRGGPRDLSTKNSGRDAADGFGDISGKPVLFRYGIE